MASVKVSEEALGFVTALSKERKIEPQDAANKLISVGYSRLTALEAYAAKGGAPKRAAKPKAAPKKAKPAAATKKAKKPAKKAKKKAKPEVIETAEETVSIEG